MAKKIYCYVDETGQDTKGKLFIVVAIVIEKERDALIENLEKTERQSGKGKTKWIKAKRVVTDKYLDMALSSKSFKHKIFYQVFAESKLYQDLTCLVVAKAINRYIGQQGISRYQAIVLIDGLRKTETRKISKSLRNLGVKTRKVKGLRDESDPVIRLADTVVGVIREAEEGNQKFKTIVKEIRKRNIINELD